jgi:NADH-quinone oxidoreductase subunit G
VPVAALTEALPGLVTPAHDGLFTSGTLSQYSPALKELERHQARELAESAAD